MDVAKAVEESKGGKITYRADRAGNVQAIIGKVSLKLKNWLKTSKLSTKQFKKQNQLQLKELT